MHVLILVNCLFQWSENFITRELTELDRLGVKMTIGSRDVLARDDLSAEETRLLERHLPIRDNPFCLSYLVRHAALALRRPSAYFAAWKALFFLRHRPSKLFRGILCLLRAGGIAEQVEKRGVDLIHAHFLTAPTETALYLSKLTGIPFGATAYAHDIYVDNSGNAAKLRHASYVNATTRYNQRSLAALASDHPEKILTLYYGIHTSSEFLPPEPRDTFTFLAVGRLVEKKGFDYLVDACGMLKRRGREFSCKIAGQGPLEDELKAKIAEMDIGDRIVLSGYVPPNRMNEFYRGGDVLVAPCVEGKNGDVDGLPNVILEAMNYGLPVIGTTISGLPEAILHGENGWLVPPNDAEALAEAMEDALAAPDLSSLRLASHRTVTERFDVRKNAIPIKELMEAACGR